jgi:hypothetical protein
MHLAPKGAANTSPAPRLSCRLLGRLKTTVDAPRSGCPAVPADTSDTLRK